jgi:membrane-bound lytic murein transglycosylase D
MGKLIKIIVLLAFISNSFALEPKNIFQDDNLILEQLLLGKKADSFTLGKESRPDKFNIFSRDPEKKINSLFSIPKYFKPSTNFWFKIYTIYSSKQVVLHDKSNLNIIFKVLDYKELRSSNLSYHTKMALQSKLTTGKVKLLKKTFKNLAKNKSNTSEAKAVLKALKDAKVKIPRNRKRKKAFFNKLASNLRAQTGQRDKILSGLKNIKPYQYEIDEYFSLMNLPKELLAIPFLESSFNVKARSKVGATGVWQFMRRVARYFMPVTKTTDGRLNPLLSTISALHLLKQNKQVLQHWDLAIPAYNSGTRHLLKAKRRLQKRIKRVRLQNILTDYKHPHLGFASKNFYSEFLALVHTLAYKKALFPELNKNFKSPRKFNSKRINVYLTKCNLVPNTFYSLLKRQSPEVKHLNQHFRRKYTKRKFPKGTIVFSDYPLNKKKYYRLSKREIKRIYPSKWGKLVKKKKCGA